MKRLLPFLCLLILAGMVIGMSTTSSQRVLAGADDALVLTAFDDTAFVLVNGRVIIDVLGNDVETNAGCDKVLDEILRGPFHSNLVFADSTYITRGDPGDVTDDSLQYVPDGDYVGPDSLLYKVDRGGGPGCTSTPDSAWVFIFVNQAPVAQNDDLTVLPNVETELDVLGNDGDPDADSLEIEGIATPPDHGMLTLIDATTTVQLRALAAPGAAIEGRIVRPPAHGKLSAGIDATAVTYTPDGGYLGPDSFEYIVHDGREGRDTAAVALLVNTVPTAGDDADTTLPGTAVDVAVLDNDTDPDGGALTITQVTSGPASGTATVNGDRITYTPNGGFVGVDMFDYEVADPLGSTATATATVTVNTPPVGVDDSFGVPFGVPTDLSVLANDTDADGDALTIDAIVTAPQNGTAAIVGSGQQLRYTPADDFFGPDSLVYRVADVRGGTSQAVLRIEVLANAVVQFIHNALPAVEVDLYVNDTRMSDDFTFQTATPFMDIPAGPAKVDVTVGTDTDNSNPIFTATVDLVPTEAYVAIATGVAGQNFEVLVQQNARAVADDTSNAEFFIAHGVLDAPASGLDLRVLDPANDNLPSQTLADDLNFKALTDYLSLPPEGVTIDVTNFDGSTQYEAYHFDLSGLKGQTFTLVLSGLLNPGGSDPAFMALGFDAQGNAVPRTVVTATEDAAELPAAFVLRGNYPNPFNPSTSIAFDLPEPAEVSVAVVDLLGRVVMTLPEQAVAAGANRTLEIDAGRLASGTYFYRLVARTTTDTMVRTGQMLLVK